MCLFPHANLKCTANIYIYHGLLVNQFLTTSKFYVHIKSCQNKLNSQAFIEPIIITIYKTSFTIDPTLIRTITILVYDHLFLTT